MLSVKQLDAMSQLELKQINRAELVDIRSVQIDTNLTAEQRMLSYLEQIKNPYFFMCDDTAVQVRFEHTGDELSSKLKRFLISLKKT